MSSGRPKWSKNNASHSTGGARTGSGRKKHDITLKFYIGPWAMVREPWCQSGWILEKKEKKRKKMARSKSRQKVYISSFFLFYIVFCQLKLSVLISIYPLQFTMPLGTEGNGRRRGCWQGLEMHLCLKPQVCFYIFFLDYINVKLQLNRLCILSPLP